MKYFIEKHQNIGSQKQINHIRGPATGVKISDWNHKENKEAIRLA
jgi:hypothetical protein